MTIDTILAVVLAVSLLNTVLFGVFWLLDCWFELSEKIFQTAISIFWISVCVSVARFIAVNNLSVL